MVRISSFEASKQRSGCWALMPPFVVWCMCSFSSKFQSSTVNTKTQKQNSLLVLAQYNQPQLFQLRKSDFTNFYLQVCTTRLLHRLNPYLMFYLNCADFLNHLIRSVVRQAFRALGCLVPWSICLLCPEGGKCTIKKTVNQILNQLSNFTVVV